MGVAGAAIKSDPRFEGDDHARKTRIKLIVGQATTSSRGVHNFNAFARPSLDDQEVIELPVDDGGELDVPEIVLLKRYGPHPHPVVARRSHDTKSRKTVTANCMV